MLCATLGRGGVGQAGLTRSADAHRSSRGAIALAWVIGLSLSAWPTAAQVVPKGTPEPAKGAELVDKRGEQVPPDIALTTADGRRVRLGEYFDGERPIVLIMGYYTCPVACQVVFNNAQRVFNQMPWTLGDEYRAVTVSFDHRDDTARAAQKRAAMLAGYDRLPKEGDWTFHTTDASSARRLGDAVGFNYRYRPEMGEFSHPTALVILSPEGIVSNYLYGVAYEQRQLRLALMDAADGEIGSVFDKILQYCSRHDPDAGKWVLAADRVMTVSATASAVVLGLGIGALFLGERYRRSRRRGRAAATTRTDSPIE